MKFVIKRTIVLMALLCGAIMCSAQAAAICEIPQISTISHQEVTVQPRADVIVNKFRMYNGRPQYRRWNETWGYWVDPAWIDS